MIILIHIIRKEVSLMRKYITINDSMLDIFKSYKTDKGFKTDNEALNYILDQHLKHYIKSTHTSASVPYLNAQFEQTLRLILSHAKSSVESYEYDLVQTFISENEIFNDNHIPPSIDFDDYCDLIIDDNSYDIDIIKHLIQIVTLRHLAYGFDIKRFFSGINSQFSRYFENQDDISSDEHIDFVKLHIRQPRTRHDTDKKLYVDEKERTIYRLKLAIKTGNDLTINDLAELYCMVYK